MLISILVDEWMIKRYHTDNGREIREIEYG